MVCLMFPGKNQVLQDKERQDGKGRNRILGASYNREKYSSCSVNRDCFVLISEGTC